MKKTWIVVGAVVAVLAIIGGIWLSIIVSDMVHVAVVDYVNERVGHLARESTGEKAVISVGDITYSLLTGSVDVDDIRIRFNDTTDTATTNASINVAEVSVSGLLPWDVLNGEGVSISEIKLDKPSFSVKHTRAGQHIVVDTTEKSDTAKFRLPRSINIDSVVHALIVGLLPQNIAPLHIGAITVADASGEFDDVGSAAQMSGSYRDLDVSIENISIGTKQSTGLHVLSSVSIHIGQVKRRSQEESLIRSSGVDIVINSKDTLFSIDTLFVQADKGYTFLTCGIDFSFSKRQLSIDSFALGPTQTDAQYYTDASNVPDRFRVNGKGLEFCNIDLRAFQRREGLLVDSIKLNQCMLDIMSSRRHLSKAAPPPMIYEIIRMLPFRIGVDVVAFTNTSIVYSELHPNTSQYAVLDWSDITCIVKGLANDTATQNATPLQFDARGTFMGATTMQAVITMPLNVKSYALTARGSIGAMDATHFNTFLPVAEKIKVASGRVVKATFDYRIKGNKATGVVDPYYSNLNIDVLDKKTRKSTFLLGIVSWVANWVGVKNDNVGEDHKEGEISYTINRNDAIMQTIWYPIKDGLGDVIGF